MKTAVITGANRGIGLAISQRLASDGYAIIGICRQSSDELANLAERVIEGIDVTSAVDVERLQKELADTTIDVLVNNAGLLENNTLGSIDFDSIQRMMEVNAYAPLRVTEALLPNMQPGSKIGLITSRMGSIADNTSGGSYGYRASKAALNAFGKSLAEDLKSRKIAVALLHPGYVKTRMVGFGGHLSPEDAANGLVDRLTGLTLENSGSFWHSNGDELPW